MKNILYFGFIFLLFSCFNSKEKTTEEQNKEKDKRRIERINEDLELRKIYSYEISLADVMIKKLEEYYSENQNYPNAVIGFEDDTISGITYLSGKDFYYTWLDTEYVLTFELPDYIGLVYFSKTKLWGLSDQMP